MNRMRDHIQDDQYRNGTGTSGGKWRSTNIIIIGFLLVLAGLVFFNPASIQVLPDCPFRRYTGLKCPGCGSMRAMHHLLRWEIVKALSSNLLAVLMLPVVSLSLILGTVTGRDLFDRLRRPIFFRVVLIVVMIFFGLRNLI
ncbi:MAG: DUF2752 domain-containing protein [Candidatus Cloacimonetes bacterium]|nr:DUF2752 domain-containing protein [Candidatus Cloacimonadota bacterium]